MKIQEIKNENFQEKNLKTKKKRKTKKRLSFVKFMLLFLLFAGAMIALALSPVFNIKAIEVYGNKNYENQEIKEISGIIIGNNGFKTVGSSIPNLFELRDGNAEKKILESCPYVKKVKAKFSLTGHMKIFITERIPIAFFHYMGNDLLVDDQGYVLGKVNKSSGNKVPQIKGIKINSYKYGQALYKTHNMNFESAVALVKAITSNDSVNQSTNLIGRIDYIDVSDTEKICISIDSEGIVNLGDLQDISYRLDYLKEIMLKNEIKGYLDFSSGENPYLNSVK